MGFEFNTSRWISNRMYFTILFDFDEIESIHIKFNVFLYNQMFDIQFKWMIRIFHHNYIIFWSSICWFYHLFFFIHCINNHIYHITCCFNENDYHQQHYTFHYFLIHYWFNIIIISIIIKIEWNSFYQYEYSTKWMVLCLVLLLFNVCQVVDDKFKIRNLSNEQTVYDEIQLSYMWFSFQINDYISPLFLCNYFFFGIMINCMRKKTSIIYKLSYIICIFYYQQYFTFIRIDCCLIVHINK